MIRVFLPSFVEIGKAEVTAPRRGIPDEKPQKKVSFRNLSRGP